MKTIKILLLAIIQLALLWLPYELQVLYDTRMGFMRQILFMNETYPVNLVIYLFWILVVLSVLLFALSKNRTKLNFIWLLILTIIVVTLTVVIGTDSSMYAYDLASFSLALLVQLIVIIINTNKERD